MSEFYLVRHGAKETREEDSPLSAVGIKQSEATAEYLENRGISSIYSSPLRRAQHTSEIIAVRLSLPITSDSRLRERLVWGDRKGETYDEFLEEWVKTSEDRQYQPQYGDSVFTSGNRVKQLFDEAAKDNSTSLIVAHSGAIGDFLRTVFPDELLPFYIEPVAKVRMVEVLYCSITTIEVNNGTYTLKKVNDTSHLPILGTTH